MSEQGPTTHELSEAYREKFVRNLVESGLMTKAFAESGILAEFGYNPESGNDTLIHTLVGDSDGGAHHLPSVMKAGPSNTRIKSWIGSEGRSPSESPPDPPYIVRPVWNYDKFKKKQAEKPNGTFTVYGVITSDETGTIWPKRNKDANADPNLPAKSTMFPNHWSAEDVISAVVEAKTTPNSSRDNPERQSITHKKTVNGVKVITVVNDKNGKIITGNPE